MAQSTEQQEPSPADKTVKAGGSSASGTPKKEQAQQPGHREKSSSSLPSPGSSGGRRGRSRTRHSGPSHANADQAGGGAERQGYHSLMSSFGKVFHVEKRWKLIREMGSGAYGYVISAVDEVSGEPVAIKMVNRVTQKIQLAKRALRELTLLRHFSHENITGLIDVDISPNHDEIYIFMEPMEADLHQIIKSGQGLTVEHVQYFVYQILRGLKYIHSASVVHRDLKPGNLLVNADCELKICDFGLSRGFNALNDETATMMTEYVATRWYRAPEIMLAYRRYGTAVDIWATGCIVAELILGRPLFKGKDYVDQLNKILDVLGSPEDKVMQRIGSEKARAYVRSLPYKKPQALTKILPTADAQALDFLGHLIAFDPVDRPTAADALAHPWLATYHDEEDEPVCQRKFDRWCAIEELETLEQYRDALVQEVYSCRKEVRNLSETPEGSRIPPIDEDIEAEDSPMMMHGALARVLSSDSIGRPNVSRKASMEPGTLHPSIPEGSVAFPGTGDPVVNYSRRSIFGHPSRTSSTYSLKQVASPPMGEPSALDPQHQAQSPPQAQPPQGKSTVAFPSTHEFVVPARHRAASMHTVGDADAVGPAEVRRLLRTLSTLSVYETAEGKAGGLADVNPIGKYIVQNHRTGDEAVQSEMPRDIMGTESTESPSAEENNDKERRFTL
ncbi:mitogen-activated protein kinase domain-containing protein [Phanerochaete sordida]|uniref:Mitogen-activated protein kinase domain-containing protein n=1 Tax=Phanerochaete sordida TaxID=48140 RepID=A0A9P3GA18_9APHY|nr:mitogen-activated protein kinase domain-containing protein [Phanerochaete sordida]